MFAGFNLSIDKDYWKNEDEFNEYKNNGEMHLNCNKKDLQFELEKYTIDNVINGHKIQEDWFPQIDADVFLSHSSKDTDLVNALAGWLNKKFNLKCFVDSNVWNYAGDLSDKLNSLYSNKRRKNNGYLYDYKSCNKVSEHVNTMLNIALYKMIDECECIILVNTDNSVSINVDNNMDLTYSPWIYSELVCSDLVRKKPLSTYRSEIQHGALFEHTEMAINYDIPIEHLIVLYKKDLKEWEKIYMDRLIRQPFKLIYKNDYPLDILYEMEKIVDKK